MVSVMTSRCLVAWGVLICGSILCCHGHSGLHGHHASEQGHQGPLAAAKEDIEVLAAVFREISKQKNDHGHHGHGHGHGHAHAHNHDHAHHGKSATTHVGMSDLLHELETTAQQGEQAPPQARLAAAMSKLLACAKDPHCAIVSDDHGHSHEQHSHAAAGRSLGGLEGPGAGAHWLLRPLPDGGVAGGTKLAAALLLFGETIVGMLLPSAVSKMDGATWYLSLLNCFAGGIFLTAGLMHLIPHCEEAQFAVDLTRWHLPDHFPLYLLLITLGYLLVFCVERVVFEGHACAHHGHLHSHDHSHNHTSKAEDDGLTDVLVRHGSSDPLLSTGMRKRKASTPERNHSSSKHSANHHHSENHHHHEEHFSVARGVPLLVGMSVHTALECLALGLITKHASFMILLAAIAAHKGVSALALAARFTKSGANLRQVLILVGPFTLIAPTSIAVGHWAGNVLPPGLQLLLNCLAAGTFLYVGASEILAEEFEGDHEPGPLRLGSFAARVTKFVVVLAAVVCIAALGLMPHVH